MLLISEDYISHHGVKGQKWGIRRYQNEDGSLTPEGIERYGKTFKSGTNEHITLKGKTKSGQEITLDEVKEAKFTKWLARNFEYAYKNSLNSPMFDVKDPNGKRIGDVQLFQESEDSVNIVWIGINESERGKGYASAALDASINECKKRGYKHMTLEVPGDSPDARHIYETRGFVAGEQISDESDVWGGLTKMRLDL